MKADSKSQKFLHTTDSIPIEYNLVREGANNKGHIPLIRQNITVGRSKECTITLVSKKISRHHCDITVRNGNIFIKDNNSPNGTFVNGFRIFNEHQIHLNDIVGIGVNTQPNRDYQKTEYVYRLKKVHCDSIELLSDDDDDVSRGSSSVLVSESDRCADETARTNTDDHNYTVVLNDEINLRDDGRNDHTVEVDMEFPKDKLMNDQIIEILDESDDHKVKEQPSGSQKGSKKIIIYPDTNKIQTYEVIQTVISPNNVKKIENSSNAQNSSENVQKYVKIVQYSQTSSGGQQQSTSEVTNSSNVLRMQQELISLPKELQVVVKSPQDVQNSNQILTNTDMVKIIAGSNSPQNNFIQIPSKSTVYASNMAQNSSRMVKIVATSNQINSAQSANMMQYFMNSAQNSAQNSMKSVNSAINSANSPRLISSPNFTPILPKSTQIINNSAQNHMINLNMNQKAPFAMKSQNVRKIYPTNSANTHQITSNNPPPLVKILNIPGNSTKTKNSTQQVEKQSQEVPQTIYNSMQLMSDSNQFMPNMQLAQNQIFMPQNQVLFMPQGPFVQQYPVIMPQMISQQNPVYFIPNAQNQMQNFIQMPQLGGLQGVNLAPNNVMIRMQNPDVTNFMPNQIESTSANQIPVNVVKNPNVVMLNNSIQYVNSLGSPVIIQKAPVCPIINQYEQKIAPKVEILNQGNLAETKIGSNSNLINVNPIYEPMLIPLNDSEVDLVPQSDNEAINISEIDSNLSLNDAEVIILSENDSNLTELTQNNMNIPQNDENIVNTSTEISEKVVQTESKGKIIDWSKLIEDPIKNSSFHRRNKSLTPNAQSEEENSSQNLAENDKTTFNDTANSSNIDEDLCEKLVIDTSVESNDVDNMSIDYQELSTEITQNEPNSTNESEIIEEISLNQQEVDQSSNYNSIKFPDKDEPLEDNLNSKDNSSEIQEININLQDTTNFEIPHEESPNKKLVSPKKAKIMSLPYLNMLKEQHLKENPPKRRNSQQICREESNITKRRNSFPLIASEIDGNYAENDFEINLVKENQKSSDLNQESSENDQIIDFTSQNLSNVDILNEINQNEPITMDEIIHDKEDQSIDQENIEILSNHQQTTEDSLNIDVLSINNDVNANIDDLSTEIANELQLNDLKINEERKEANFETFNSQQDEIEIEKHTDELEIQQINQETIENNDEPEDSDKNELQSIDVQENSQEIIESSHELQDLNENKLQSVEIQEKIQETSDYELYDSQQPPAIIKLILKDNKKSAISKNKRLRRRQLKSALQTRYYTLLSHIYKKKSTQERITHKKSKKNESKQKLYTDYVKTETSDNENLPADNEVFILENNTNDNIFDVIDEKSINEDDNHQVNEDNCDKETLYQQINEDSSIVTINDHQKDNYEENYADVKEMIEFKAEPQVINENSLQESAINSVNQMEIDKSSQLTIENENSSIINDEIEINLPEDVNLTDENTQIEENSEIELKSSENDQQSCIDSNQTENSDDYQQKTENNEEISTNDEEIIQKQDEITINAEITNQNQSECTQKSEIINNIENNQETIDKNIPPINKTTDSHEKIEIPSQNKSASKTLKNKSKSTINPIVRQFHLRSRLKSISSDDSQFSESSLNIHDKNKGKRTAKKGSASNGDIKKLNTRVSTLRKRTRDEKLTEVDEKLTKIQKVTEKSAKNSESNEKSTEIPSTDINLSEILKNSRKLTLRSTSLSSFYYGQFSSSSSEGSSRKSSTVSSINGDFINSPLSAVDSEFTLSNIEENSKKSSTSQNLSKLNKKSRFIFKKPLIDPKKLKTIKKSFGTAKMSSLFLSSHHINSMRSSTKLSAKKIARKNNKNAVDDNNSKITNNEIKLVHNENKSISTDNEINLIHDDTNLNKNPSNETQTNEIITEIPLIEEKKEESKKFVCRRSRRLSRDHELSENDTNDTQIASKNTEIDKIQVKNDETSSDNKIPSKRKLQKLSNAEIELNKSEINAKCNKSSIEHQNNDKKIPIINTNNLESSSEASSTQSTLVSNFMKRRIQKLTKHYDSSDASHQDQPIKPLKIQKLSEIENKSSSDNESTYSKDFFLLKKPQNNSKIPLKDDSSKISLRRSARLSRDEDYLSNASESDSNNSKNDLKIKKFMLRRSSRLSKDQEQSDDSNHSKISVKQSTITEIPLKDSESSKFVPRRSRRLSREQESSDQSENDTKIENIHKEKARRLSKESVEVSKTPETLQDWLKVLTIDDDVRNEMLKKELTIEVAKIDINVSKDTSTSPPIAQNRETNMDIMKKILENSIYKKPKKIIQIIQRNDYSDKKSWETSPMMQKMFTRTDKTASESQTLINKMTSEKIEGKSSNLSIDIQTSCSTDKITEESLENTEINCIADNSLKDTVKIEESNENPSEVIVNTQTNSSIDESNEKLTKNPSNVDNINENSSENTQLRSSTDKSPENLSNELTISEKSPENPINIENSSETVPDTQSTIEKLSKNAIVNKVDEKSIDESSELVQTINQTDKISPIQVVNNEQSTKNTSSVSQKSLDFIAEIPASRLSDEHDKRTLRSTKINASELKTLERLRNNEASRKYVRNRKKSLEKSKITTRNDAKLSKIAENIAKLSQKKVNEKPSLRYLESTEKSKINTRNSLKVSKIDKKNIQKSHKDKIKSSEIRLRTRNAIQNKSNQLKNAKKVYQCKLLKKANNSPLNKLKNDEINEQHNEIILNASTDETKQEISSEKLTEINEHDGKNATNTPESLSTIEYTEKLLQTDENNTKSIIDSQNAVNLSENSTIISTDDKSLETSTITDEINKTSINDSQNAENSLKSSEDLTTFSSNDNLIENTTNNHEKSINDSQNVKSSSENSTTVSSEDKSIEYSSNIDAKLTNDLQNGDDKNENLSESLIDLKIDENSSKTLTSTGENQIDFKESLENDLAECNESTSHSNDRDKNLSSICISEIHKTPNKPIKNSIWLYTSEEKFKISSHNNTDENSLQISENSSEIQRNPELEDAQQTFDENSQNDVFSSPSHGSINHSSVDNSHSVISQEIFNELLESFEQQLEEQNRAKNSPENSQENEMSMEKSSEMQICEEEINENEVDPMEVDNVAENSNKITVITAEFNEISLDTNIEANIVQNTLRDSKEDDEIMSDSNRTNEIVENSSIKANKIENTIDDEENSQDTIVLNEIFDESIEVIQESSENALEIQEISTNIQTLVVNNENSEILPQLSLIPQEIIQNIQFNSSESILTTQTDSQDINSIQNEPIRQPNSSEKIVITSIESINPIEVDLTNNEVENTSEILLNPSTIERNSQKQQIESKTQPETPINTQNHLNDPQNSMLRNILLAPPVEANKSVITENPHYEAYQNETQSTDQSNHAQVKKILFTFLSNKSSQKSHENNDHLENPIKIEPSTSSAHQSQANIILICSDDESDDDKKPEDIKIISKLNLIPAEKSILKKSTEKKNLNKKITFFNSVYVRTFVPDDNEYIYTDDDETDEDDVDY